MFHKLIYALAVRREHAVLAAMLLVLHVALWADFGGAMSRSLMLAHLGLFLIWQPVWSRDRRLAPSTLAAFLGLTAIGILWLSWWMVFCWLVLLIGLVAGRTVNSRRARYAYLLTLLFLVSQLLIRALPALFAVAPLPRDVVFCFQVGLPLVPLLLAVVPFRGESGTVDFFRGVAVALLVAVLAIGSLLNMYHRGVDYPQALAESLIALAGFLFLISWLLSPHRGFQGFAQLWERSLLNIGTPFEGWLGELAECSERHQTPGRFLEASMQALARLPWVAAVEWTAPESEGVIGTPTQHEIEMPIADLRIRLYTRRAVGPTLLLHCKLLLQLLAQFYLAKVRERALAEQAHLQAIYETGARVTHDIKNILQSLHLMTAALDRDRPTPPGDGERRRKGVKAQKLFERQLPHLAQRLQLALDKLQAPQQATTAEQSVRAWWAALRERLEGAGVRCEAELEADPMIPTELFDSAVENLLDNARAKQTIDSCVQITVRLTATAEELTLEVEDSGAPVPRDKAAQLCRQPVDSDNGLGIGLYQAARQAELLGYELRLTSNAPGRVVFELARCRPSGEQRQYPLFATGASA